MSRDLKNIDQLFRSGLDGQQETPPSDIWESITGVLDKDAPPLPSIPAARSSNKWRRSALIIAFLITGTMLLYYKGVKETTAVTSPPSPIKYFSGERESTNSLATAEQINAVVSNSAITSTPDQADANDPGDVFVPTNVADKSPAPITAISSRLLEETIPTHTLGDAATSLNNMNPSPQVSEKWGPAATLAVATQTKATNTAIPVVNKKALLLHRFSFTVFFAPDITTRNLEQNTTGTPDESKDLISRTEKNNALDFTVGTRIEYKINNRFSLQSGISFSSNTISIEPKTIFARSDVDGVIKYRLNCSSGYAFIKPKTTSTPLQAGDSTQALSSTTVLHYVNIPLAVKYTFATKGRFNLSAQAGITARFITKHSIASVYAIGNTKENTTDQIQGLKTSYFNGVVGLGADYSLNKRVAISLFPSFNFATTAINRNSPVKAYPNTLSIATGIKFNL